MIKKINAVASKMAISDTPPEHLNQVAKEVWLSTLKTVNESGYQIDAIDIECFTAYCSAASTIRECDDLLERDGLCVDGGREGLKRHPAAAVKNAALVQLRAYATSLGLTAASRGRLPKVEAEKVNAFAQFGKQ